MDWQHLIMNGEHLPEYAALLDAEGLLGHQHANSGWGTFDDDNMVGATAFMETLELALELRRAGYGSNGERLGFDLYPYTEDQVAAVKRQRAAVAVHRRRRGAHRRAGAARGAARQGRRPRLRAGLRRARAREQTLAGLDVGTSSVKGLAVAEDGAVLGAGRGRVSALDAAAGLVASRTPRTGGARRAAVLDELRAAGDARRHRAVRADARARAARRRPARCCARRSSGTTGAPAPSAPRSRSASGRERLVALTGNRALTGFTAPKLLWVRRHEPDVVRAHRARDAARRTTCGCG